MKVVLLPVFNEDTRIAEVLKNVARCADLLIVVNDGSTDTSPHLLAGFAEGNSTTLYLSIEKNRGKAAALRDALRCAQDMLQEGKISPEDVIVTIDADGQHWAQEIDKIASFMENGGYDAVIARRDFSAYPLYKIIGNRILSLNASILANFRFHDSECGLRLFKAGLLPKILPYYTGVRYSCEQELSILLRLSGARLSNDYSIRPTYYRSNTTLRDAYINIALGWIAFLRFQFGLTGRTGSLTACRDRKK